MAKEALRAPGVPNYDKPELVSRRDDDDDDDIVSDEPEEDSGAHDDDESASDEPEDEEQPKSRKQKRRERGELFRANQQMSEELAAARRDIARLEGYASRFPAPEDLIRREQNQDPLLSALQEAFQAGESLRREYNALSSSGQMTPEAEQHLRQRAFDVDNRAGYIRAQIAHRDAQANMPSPEQVANMVLSRQVREENADVYSDPRAAQIAIGRFFELRAQGRAEGKELHDECMEYARSRTNKPLRRSKAPTRGEKARYSGVPTSSGGASGVERASLPRNKANESMAAALHPEIRDKEKRWKAFVRHVAKQKD